MLPGLVVRLAYDAGAGSSPDKIFGYGGPDRETTQAGKPAPATVRTIGILLDLVRSKCWRQTHETPNAYRSSNNAVNWFKQLFGAKSNGEASPDTLDPDSSSTVASRAESRQAQVATRPAPDLVDGINALAEYYRYREAEAYDRGLKTMREHRDFRDELLKRSDAVLAYENDDDARSGVQHAIAKEEAAFRATFEAPTPDPATEARSRDPQGYALLSLTAPLTLETLKTAYRKAALSHHPDVGGDNETMGKVNDAYELFSAVLRRQSAEQTLAASQQSLVSANVESFFRAVRFGKSSMFIDDLAADAAFDAYENLKTGDLEGQFRAWDVMARMAELLAACNRPDDAKKVLHDLGTLVDDGEKRGLNLSPIYRKASEACCDPKSIRFIPNHARQADNLLRLGIIDQKRYDAILTRVGQSEGKLSAQEDAFERFTGSYHFLQLPMDPAVDTMPISGLVPGPDYYARVETMSEVQRREYARAFHGGAAELTLKYLAVRMDALLRSPFVGYRDIDAVLAELQALDTAPGMKPGLDALCAEALKVISFLASLSEKERDLRIATLKILDSIPGPMMTISAIGISISMPRPIMMNPTFTQFATGPMERIERYAKTGSELTESEKAERRKQWEASRAFHDSDVYKRARDATWKDKTAEAVVPAVSSLCEALYGRAASPQNESLEIGYWTDKLTIALVKMKRYDEALRWIQRYDDTPEQIKARDSGGVLESLRKRKARCLSSLRRDL